MSTLETPIVYCWNSIYPYELLNHCVPQTDPDNPDRLILESMYHTVETPPPPKEGFAVCRDMINKQWVYLPDYRGKQYWTKDMQWNDAGLPILYPGELPEGASFNPPSKPSSLKRMELRQALKSKKIKLREQGLVVSGIKFDTDYNAEIAYLTFLNKTKDDPKYTTRWKASKGIWITMNRELCLKVKKLVDEYINNIYKWEEEKEILLINLRDNELDKFTL